MFSTGDLLAHNAHDFHLNHSTRAMFISVLPNKVFVCYFSPNAKVRNENKKKNKYEMHSSLHTEWSLEKSVEL